ncbi:MAG: phosphotransferase [Deltaproteobacteria bacterium]|nr:phosphotransferase [Deltaproteobacteria bacterium]MBI3389212.1 phosphotransferase [Deltaproteobacteria bacterium]
MTVAEEETLLRGGRTTAEVVRIGDTVRRPMSSQSAFVHSLLGHLEGRGFAGAPRFLGVDSSGREILSYLPGEVPNELGEFTRSQLVSAALLLRELHDATTDYQLREGCEVVCHGDASPCNCVFVDGRPVAFIDFDAARPGRRRDDVGYAAWLWLDIGRSNLAPHSQGRRIAEFFLAYGAIEVADSLPAVLDAQTELSRRPNTPSATKRWAQRCRAWVEQHLAELTRAVNAPTV